MKKILFKSIGTIRSPYRKLTGMPIQPAGAEGVSGTVVVHKEYGKGLKDLDGFSHIILLYYFHRSKGTSLLVRPYLDEEYHGVFATRYPNRPNPIGISVVRLIGIERNILNIRDVDILNGTPLLDIKPYVPQFDTRKSESIGWLSEKVAGVSGTRCI
jgi:tRNA-Thr(GGU) m(6)t(6)A37 methyltransferase TsaA